MVVIGQLGISKRNIGVFRGQPIKGRVDGGGQFRGGIITRCDFDHVFTVCTLYQSGNTSSDNKKIASVIPVDGIPRIRYLIGIQFQGQHVAQGFRQFNREIGGKTVDVATNVV